MATSNLITAAASTKSSAVPKDTNSPYSYQEWRARNENIPTNNAYKVYVSYVREWYVKSNTNQTTAIDYVKNYYKQFLLELGLSPRSLAEKTFFTTVNIDDDTSLQSVIVGYARRLKDVSIYIANKRNHIVYTKLKYSLIGTSVSLEKLFYNYLLNAFTRKSTIDANIVTSLTITDPDILNNLPLLSDISKNFTVEIQELYDTSSYLNRNPADPIDKYISPDSSVSEVLYTAGNYDLPLDYIIAEVISAAATSTST